VRTYRIVGLLFATAVAVLIAPAVAHAEPYPDQPPDSSVSEGTVSDGGAVTFSGGGFLPGETISVEVHYGSSDSTAALSDRATGGFVLAAVALPRAARFEVTASSDGTFSTPVTLTQTGTATIVATGLTSGVTVTSTVHVTVAEDNNNNNNNSAGGGNTLPTTGGSGRTMAMEIAGGVGAIALGAVLLWLTSAWRRRSSDS
jgi:hypothetical protein